MNHRIANGSSSQHDHIPATLQQSNRKIPIACWRGTCLEYPERYKKVYKPSWIGSPSVLLLVPVAYLIMHLSIVSLVALASAPLTLAQLPSTSVAPTLPVTLPTTLAYPITQILPVPGWNTTTDSFNSLARLYSNSSTRLYSHIVAIGRP